MDQLLRKEKERKPLHNEMCALPLSYNNCHRGPNFEFLGKSESTNKIRIPKVYQVKKKG